jgi:hypothetical protein
MSMLNEKNYGEKNIIYCYFSYLLLKINKNTLLDYICREIGHAKLPALNCS